MSIKLTVSFFASKTLFSYLHWLIYLSHFAFKGFEFSLAPLVGHVGGARDSRKKNRGKERGVLKLRCLRGGFLPCLPTSAWLSSPGRLGLRVKLVGGSWEWNSASAGHPDLGRGQVSFGDPFSFRSPQASLAVSLGPLGHGGGAGGRGEKSQVTKRLDSKQPGLLHHSPKPPPLAQLKAGV